MNLENDELKTVLRRVDVPADLKDRLRAISGSGQLDLSPEISISEISDFERKLQMDATTVGCSDEHKTGAMAWLAIGLAASLAGVGVYLLWPTQVADVPIAISKPAIDSSLIAENESGDRRLVDLIADTEKLKLRLMEWDLDQIENRLSRLQMTELKSRVRKTSISESAALILTLANQSAIRMGVDPQTVQSELQSVVEKYPDSQSAVLAREILTTEL